MIPLTALPPALRITLPLRCVNPLNRREHWVPRSQRAAEHRLIVRVLLRDWPKEAPLPVTVTLTRIGPRTLDSDAVPASLKAVRDGVQDVYGVDDSDERYSWVYAQERGSYGVRIEVVSK